MLNFVNAQKIRSSHSITVCKIFAADEVQACHLVLETIKLAYADAAATVADARFFKIPSRISPIRPSSPRVRVLDGKRVSIETHSRPALGERLAAMGPICRLPCSHLPRAASRDEVCEICGLAPATKSMLRSVAIP